MCTNQQRAVQWALQGGQERKDTPQPQSDLDKGNGKSHSDRSQVIGGKLLIEQLAYGLLTVDEAPQPSPPRGSYT